MRARWLGWTGLEVSPLGMGCWAIGGPTEFRGSQFGWGQVDESEAIRAIQAGLDGGITFIDTADIYGTGHSERIVGRALAGRRDGVVVATKFGLTFDEYSGTMTGRDASPAYIRQACEASLRRLGTDYIDLYQFHVGGYDPAAVDPVLDVLDELVAAGKIRYYAWGTGLEGALRFVERGHCPSVQFGLNLLTMVFPEADRMLAFCDAHDLAAIINGPLGKGLLTGKFDQATRFAEGDLRRQRGWDVQDGPLAVGRRVVEQLRDILTSDGRTLAQAALGALWARSPRCLPIPGFKTVAQVHENVGALEYGPLSPQQMRAVADLVTASFTEEEAQSL
ncbi:MAG TPA: aldo/keto reductase [Nocardioides sp.]|uniref:aldo/keto reductase n=1 Tax=Nocardioides sp. TaxID=35761 RepID=UPI002F3FDEB4